MAVYKVKLTVTVLLEAESLAAATAALDGVHLGHIDYSINEGDWIGGLALDAVNLVTQNDVRNELHALGNDGEFFGAAAEGLDAAAAAFDANANAETAMAYAREAAAYCDDGMISEHERDEILAVTRPYREA